MNDWYIDRSMNFINSTFDSVIAFLYNYNGNRDSKSIIDKLISNCIFDEDSGNPNAALTRFRDHGIINNINELGEPAIDYIEKRLSRDELIIDLLIKRPAMKKRSVNLKPLVLVCKFFDTLYDIVVDENDVYISYEECYKYLYNCNSLVDVSAEFVDNVIENRNYSNTIKIMKQNDFTNLSIWFNALCNTPIFLQGNERTIIRPNPFAKPFIKFISINGFKISETPTNTNTELYNYYCKRENGISEIIPNVFLPSVIVKNQYDSKVIYNYVFGIKKEPTFDFNTYFTKDCFGVYHAFLLVPGLAMREVWHQNKALGSSLFEIILKR